jgi:hypothetical protein
VWKNFTLRLDGQEIGSFATQKDLKQGGRFRLEDGRTLEAKLGQNFLFPELQLTLDGTPLPGSGSDPAQRLKASYGMIFFVAGFNMLLGFLAGAADVRFLQGIGLGYGACGAGVIYGVLGFFVTRRSKLALALAVGLFVLDGIALVAFSAQKGRAPNPGGLVARVFFLIPMIQGFGAIGALQDAERAHRRAARRPASGAAGSGPAGVRSTATAPTPVDSARPPVQAAPPAARILSGDAERRRLELSGRVVPQAPATGAARRMDLKAKSEVDSAATELRFVARKCEITPEGLRLTYPDGKSREARWAQLAGLVIRLLPPDPPWNAMPLVDAVVTGPTPGTWQVLRIFSTTIVNYGAIPGGASTSRLENTRRLAAHIAAQSPSLALDPETAAFIKEGKPPARFVNMTHFTEYDVRYV